MTMNTRQSWVIGTAIVLGCLILGLFFGQPSVAQKKKDDPATPGRYQMLEDKGAVYVIDTVTGNTWINKWDDKEKWDDLGSPAQQKKK
jgi:hypothetical protein